MKDKVKICHIVPSNFGGGVEAAANTFISYSCQKFIFSVYFIKSSRNENSLISYLKSIKYLYQNKPDILLTSLWKSNILALIYKIFSYDSKLILFLHSTKNTHFLDIFYSNLTAMFAFEIWADSKITLQKRIRRLYIFRTYKYFFKKNIKKRFISLVKEEITSITSKKCKPSFIYWGRLSQEKNIDKAIEFFSKIHKFNNKSTFTIIGPDSGEKKSLCLLIKKLDLNDNIHIFDFMNFNQIKEYAKKSSFFIQLSTFEGMAMSVSESMQLGLIPVVTSVGEINIYCKNLHNSFIYNDNEDEIIKEIFKLISNKSYYTKMRENSIKTWTNSSIYKNDLIKIFNEISNY